MTDSNPLPQQPVQQPEYANQPAYGQGSPYGSYEQSQQGQVPSSQRAPQYPQPTYSQYGQPYSYPQQPNPSDTGSFGWAVLGFFVPVVGLVLWLIWKDTQPRNALKAGKGALVSVIVWAVFFVLYIVLIIGLVAWSASSSTSAIGLL